jgi:hypothetical protein
VQFCFSSFSFGSAGVAVGLLCIFELTLFAAMLGLFGRLEEDNRHFLLCCIKLSSRDTTGKLKSQ